MGTSEEAHIVNNKKDRIKGVYPSIAANSSGDVVCVYNHIWRNDIYDGVGALQEGAMLWKSHNHVCAGKYPRVAINEDKQVVMVYSKSSAIKYRAGIVVGTRVTWCKTEYDISVGQYPSIATSGNKVIIVYQASYNVHYCFGIIGEGNDGTIMWMQRGVELQINASYPSVAMNDNFITVIYNSGSSYSLMITVGEVFGDRTTVTWGEVQADEDDSSGSSEFAGQYPSVAVLRDAENTIVTTFQTGTMAGRRLYARCGKVQSSASKKIKWHEKKAGNFVHGCYSSVAAVTDKTFLEMHSTNGFGWDGIWYHVCMAGVVAW